jgi:primosomal protein N' (replication factor Y)
MSQLPLLEIEKAECGTSDRHLVSVVIPPLENPFLYSFDPAAHPSLSVGSLVTVQFGKRTVAAFVLSVDSPAEFTAREEMAQRGVKIRPIIRTDSPCHAFAQEHLEFYQWIARYHAEPLSKILDLAVPAPAPRKPEPFFRALPAQPNARLGASQRAVIDALGGGSEWVPLASLRSACSASASTLRSLVSRGFIEERLGSDSPQVAPPDPASLSLRDSLTQQQRAAVDAAARHIDERSFAPFLLPGVTGSGKTEVYLELIVAALKQGRSALVVVPEIALTPQLIDRFEARLKQRVALLHSSLKQKDRWGHWEALLAGEVRVAIGARSGIFAPMRDLGLIVIDEEHDASFKQGEGIRYNARDLALVRAKLSSCPIILGSATPSLETFHNARCERYSYLRLSERFHSPPPPRFTLVDLNRTKPWEMPSRSISPQLLQGLTETLAAGEQAFILYNRRGFASYLQCSACEQVVGCPQCSVTLTYHRKNNSLLCHFCGFSTPPPVACSGCGAHDKPQPSENGHESIFSHRGAGTERVAEELAELLPQACIAKLDRDSVRSLEDYVRILSQVRSREVDILVGTQMIAKGHDLPDVTFVGVVDCDVGLHVPDFRAAERSFQLLTQASGRAGRRGGQGRIVLQTRVPSHPSLQQTIRDDYTAFADAELLLRESLEYPPFRRLLRIIIAAEDKGMAQQWAQRVASHTATACAGSSVHILGPAPAPLEKIRNHWRYHILCKAASAGALQAAMQRIKGMLPDNKSIRIIFDLDPQDML